MTLCVLVHRCSVVLKAWASDSTVLQHMLEPLLHHTMTRSLSS